MPRQVPGEPYYRVSVDEASGMYDDDDVVIIDVRRLQHVGRSWVAELAVFHEPPLWRGLITFHIKGVEEGAQHIARHSTGDVFREDHSEDVRERFRSFSEGTLQAFLRSVIS